MTVTPPLGSPDGSAERDEPAVRSTPLHRNRWLLGAVGVAIVALAYGVGRIQGALALTSLKEETERDRRALQDRFEGCETARYLLEARRNLSLVALSLDRRNFGVAETQRRSALHMLEQPPVRGIPKATELASTIRALNLAVDPDPGAEREYVIAVSEALDKVLASLNSGKEEAAARTGPP